MARKTRPKIAPARGARGIKTHAPDAGDPNFMASLARGLRVLQVFDLRRRALTVSQASEATGIPRAASRRCLYTLEKLGFVSVDNGRYSLRPKVFTLGFAHLSSLPLATAAQPLLDRCRDRLHESCSLGVLDVGDVYYQARAEAYRIMSVALFVGSRLPAYCTSMGRVLLANRTDAQIEAYLASTVLQPRTAKTVTSPDALCEALAVVRRTGYAIVDQELELGLRSIAVALRDRSGTLIGAINVGTQSVRVSLKEMVQRLLPELQLTAADLAQLV